MISRVVAPRRRTRLKSALRRAGLLTTAFRIYEFVLALRGLARRQQASDNLPLPPALLRVRVVGSGNPEVFLRKGAHHASIISDALAGAGAPIEEAGAVLDFGCGCGRVARHWRDLPGEVHGSDQDEAMVRWCSANLPFGHFTVNGLAPPLMYANHTFDVVYALSVFTHIPENLQEPWFEELARVIRPGGHLLITTHGEACAETKLAPQEQEAFMAGRIVALDEVAGSNVCAMFHPIPYVRDTLSDGLTEAAFHAGRQGGLMQDLWLFRKPLEHGGQDAASGAGAS